MDLIKARFLLENLLDWVETHEDGSKQLSGKLTNNELQALQFALTLFDSQVANPILSITSPKITTLPNFEQSEYVDSKENINEAFEVKNTSCCLTEAGNYLDKLLSTIIRNTGISFDNPSWTNINWSLEKNIRNHK